MLIYDRLLTHSRFSQLHPTSLSCADPGIFVRGGGPGQSDKKALTTFFFFLFLFFF